MKDETDLAFFRRVYTEAGIAFREYEPDELEVYPVALIKLQTPMLVYTFRKDTGTFFKQEAAPTTTFD